MVEVSGSRIPRIIWARAYAGCVLRYYWKLLRHLPQTLVEAGSRWLTIIGLLITLLVAVGAVRDDSISPLLNPDSGRTPWSLGHAPHELGGVPHGDPKATRTEQAEKLNELLRDQLQDCEKRYQVSQKQYEVFKDFYKEQGFGS